MPNSPVVEVKDISVVLGKNRILEGISFAVAPGEMVGIIGPNGAGKTTLMRVLLGLLRPTSGQVRLFGRDHDKMGKKRDLIGYMPQRPVFGSHFPLTCLDVVIMGSFTATSLGKLFIGAWREKARYCLEMVGLLPLEKVPFTELSGGQQQRVFLARALIKEPLLLFLDEPNAGLDLPTQNNFFALLQELQSLHGLTVLIVSHDLVMISRFAGRLICINQTMHIHGAPRDVLGSSSLEKAYRCEFDFISEKVRA
ncbi:MAG: metal ABC transporter ATP-binding protein [Dethiobacteria bacterium]|jgi:zinc transport system ATP-binding protein